MISRQQNAEYASTRSNNNNNNKIMCFSISYKDVAAVKDNNEICIALSQPSFSLLFYLCVMYSKHELKVNFIHKIKSCLFF